MVDPEDKNTSAEQNIEILEDDPVMKPEREAGEASGAEVSEAASEPGEEDAAAGDEKEIDKLRKDFSDLNDRHLRLHAEFENYKRRMARDRENLSRHANERIVGDLLTVIDHLEMAVTHAEGSSVDKLLQGVQMTLKEFETLLERHGVKPVIARGKQFDPTLHHAMNQVVTDEAEANSVLEEFRKGYMLNDKLIRPALVSVAKAPEGDAGESPEADEADVDRGQEAEPAGENGEA